ncbi:MAG: polyisoprenoid-binding protein YceI [Oleiphilaceae bacterium]|jgi:polyisoprenoid-binding protein YceI
MKKTCLCLMLVFVCLSGAVQAAKYKVDVAGAHAFITFKIKHLGYSWLLGRFNQFDGEFEYDANQPANSTIRVLINTSSIDSNHAERDKHLRGEDFLNVSEYPEASFVSKKFEVAGPENAVVTGAFTLHGVTKEISFPVQKVGEGNDPWGGYRAGFTGKTELKLSDYGITYNLGPASTMVEIELNIEGIRQ